MRESTLTDKIPEILRKTVLGAKITRISREVLLSKFLVNMVADVTIGTTKRKFIFEVKSLGTPQNVLLAASKLRLLQKRFSSAVPVFVAPGLTQRAQALCREFRMGYLDLAGNAYLNFDGVWIDKHLADLPEDLRPRLKTRVAKNIFHGKNSRILRILLRDPKRKWELKNLAQAASLSLGHSHAVVQKLIQEGFLERDTEKILRLTRPGELLDAWAKIWMQPTTRSKPYYTKFKHLPDFFRLLSRCPHERYALTLHAGSSLVAPFVHYTDVHLYIQGDENEWVGMLELEPIEFGGTIHLLDIPDPEVLFDSQLFSGFDLFTAEETNNIRVVSNLQLYLDLFTYPTRGREQAGFLRKEKIGF